MFISLKALNPSITSKFIFSSKKSLSLPHLRIFILVNLKKIIDNIVKNLPSVVSLSGKVSMQEEIQIISHLKLMVSMDSGNAHIAAMMGVKVITLWGVTHPFLGFQPFNQPLENCLLADRKLFPLIPTSVYGNNYPSGYEDAIATISEDKILQAINDNI